MTTGPSNAEGVAAPSAAGELVTRFGARVIDSIIVAVVGIALGFLLDFGLVWLAIQSILVFAYFVVLDVVRGATLGKQLLGLEVIGPDGGRPTLPQAAIREAFTLLGAIPYIGPVLALIAWIVIAVTINSSPTGQGKHDELAGGTRVRKA
ncbi:MAG: RDD family protein [Acidimicrobiales bacterium]